MSAPNCCFLTCIQISQEAGKVVWYSHLLKNFPQFVVIHIVKGFGIVNKAEVDVFLVFSCFFDDPVDVGNLMSGSSGFSKSGLNIWKFMVHVLLKPGLESFEHYFASIWDECNCAVVWAVFGIAFLWDWNENWPFSDIWPSRFPEIWPFQRPSSLCKGSPRYSKLDNLFRMKPVDVVATSLESQLAGQYGLSGRWWPWMP